MPVLKRANLIFCAFFIGLSSAVPSWAQAQPATELPTHAVKPPEFCPNPPYAAEVAEISTRAHAQFQVAISKVLQDELAKNKDKPQDDLKISLSGRMVSAALGGFASQALIDTFDNYFCRFKVAARGDSQLIAKLRERHLQIREAIILIFDPALYGQSPMQTAEERSEDRARAKDDHKKMLEEIKAYTPIWTVEAAGPAIPAFNYSKVTTWQFNADAVIGSFANAGACLGMVRKSVRVVKPEVLVALDKARSEAIWWITGEADFVEQDIRQLASVILKAQAAKPVEAEQQLVTPAFTTCVDESKKAAEGKAPSADPDSATAPTKPGDAVVTDKPAPANDAAPASLPEGAQPESGESAKPAEGKGQTPSTGAIG